DLHSHLRLLHVAHRRQATGATRIRACFGSERDTIADVCAGRAPGLARVSRRVAMYLRRLELHGFKTFAPRTVLEFESGVTAVVGPNGSGKSNLADAVRWALGEQNVRNVRCRTAEDLIFAGTS